MAKIAIIGAGFAGHTAALYLGDALGKEHTITVINRHEYFYYVPSWVWVGIGRMSVERTRFPWPLSTRRKTSTLFMAKQRPFTPMTNL